MLPILVLLLIVAFVLFLSGIRVAQEYERGVVFRLGRYEGTRGPGLYWNAPLIERQRKIDLRTRTVSVEQQETITRDSVTIRVNAVLWFRVLDPRLSIVAVADYRDAVYQVALTSLRNVIGQHDLDEVLRSRDRINDQLAAMVDRATEPWGVKIEAVEMKDVEIPEAMQRAMAREAEAVREKRARIIKAEAEQEASVRLGMAAREIAANPVALELRRLQMVSEVGAENNSTTILMIPTEFLALASSLNRTFTANADAADAAKAAAKALPPASLPESLPGADGGSSEPALVPAAPRKA